CRSRASFRLDDSSDVALRIEEVRHGPNRRNMGLRCGEAAAMCLDGANRLVDVRHGNRALEADYLLTRRELSTVLQAAAHGVDRFLSRLDQIETGRAPRLEAPAEDGFVEFPGAGHIVCVDGEERDVVWHDGDCTTDRRATSCARVTTNVAKPPNCDL